MRETSIETLKRLEATGFDDPHDFRECATERLRLDSRPPVAAPNEGE